MPHAVCRMPHATCRKRRPLQLSGMRALKAENFCAYEYTVKGYASTHTKCELNIGAETKRKSESEREGNLRV